MENIEKKFSSAEELTAFLSETKENGKHLRGYLDHFQRIYLFNPKNFSRLNPPLGKPEFHNYTISHDAENDLFYLTTDVNIFTSYSQYIIKVVELNLGIEEILGKAWSMNKPTSGLSILLYEKDKPETTPFGLFHRYH